MVFERCIDPGDKGLCSYDATVCEIPCPIPEPDNLSSYYYFSDQGDLVLDPMAGGGVVADTCLALNRRCWSFDMDDRPDTRSEIESYFWDITNLKWPLNHYLLKQVDSCYARPGATCME